MSNPSTHLHHYLLNVEKQISHCESQLSDLKSHLAGLRVQLNETDKLQAKVASVVGSEPPVASNPKSSVYECKRLIRMKEVIQLTGLARSTIYRMLEDGKFPKPVNPSPVMVAWIKQDIENWIDGLIRLRDQ